MGVLSRDPMTEMSKYHHSWKDKMVLKISTVQAAPFKGVYVSSYVGDVGLIYKGLRRI